MLGKPIKDIEDLDTLDRISRVSGPASVCQPGWPVKIGGARVLVGSPSPAAGT